jgi:Uma2 family endonuclease
MAFGASPMTADEFLALPEHKFIELIDGELIVHQPNLRHQRILTQLVGSFVIWQREVPGRGVPLLNPNVLVDEHTVLGPDLVWLREPPRLAGAYLLAEMLDLVVEVRSPSTGRYDDRRKRAIYEEAGVAEYWRIDGDKASVRIDRRSTPDAPAFDVHVIVGVGDPLTSPLLPGLTIDLGELLDR